MVGNCNLGGTEEKYAYHLFVLHSDHFQVLTYRHSEHKRTTYNGLMRTKYSNYFQICTI